MIKNHFILAAGSYGNSAQLTRFFLREGWLAMAITNKPDAARFLKESQFAPECLFIDSLKDWVVQLAKELHSQGTQIRVYGFLKETHEELSERLGVPFYSTMGLPSKAVGVLMGKEFRDDDIFSRVEIKMMKGSIFDRKLQNDLDLDSLVVFRRDGFNPMELYTSQYMSDPNPLLVDKTVVWSFGREPREPLVRHKVAEMLTEVSSRGGSIVGISQIDFTGGDGSVIDDIRADMMLSGIVTRFLDGAGRGLRIKKVYILIDDSCRPLNVGILSRY